MNLVGPQQCGSLTLEEAEHISEAAGWHDARYLPTQRGGATVQGGEIQLGSVVITHEAWDARVQVTGGTPSGTIGFGVRLDGPSECTGWGREVGANQVMRVVPDLDLVLGVGTGFVATVLSVEHLRDHANKLGLDIEHGLSQPSGFAHSQAGRALGRELESLALPGTATQVREEVESRFLSVACLALSVPEQTPGVIDFSQRARLAMRARDFIEADLAAPFRLEELARSLDRNVRAIQRAFHDTFGMSPSRYVHARRLRRARLRLMAADARRTTVTSVAFDCGFAHLGRFSAEYRIAFGETPSTTLRLRSH